MYTCQKATYSLSLQQTTCCRDCRILLELGCASLHVMPTVEVVCVQQSLSPILQVAQSLACI